MRKYLSSLVLIAVVLGGASLALAAGNWVIVADIPNAFLLDGKTLPSGQYEFQEDTSNPEVVRVRNISTGKETMALSMSRLAPREGIQSAVVFDHVGDQFYLSELHLANTDGFYFKGAPGKHTHTTVKARKKA
jgi:hypothetical protein